MGEASAHGGADTEEEHGDVESAGEEPVIRRRKGTHKMTRV